LCGRNGNNGRSISPLTRLDGCHATLWTLWTGYKKVSKSAALSIELRVQAHSRTPIIE
jgi:hypothetical protein